MGENQSGRIPILCFLSILVWKVVDGPSMTQVCALLVNPMLDLGTNMSQPSPLNSDIWIVSSKLVRSS